MSIRHSSSRHGTKRIIERTDLSLKKLDKTLSHIYEAGYRLRHFEGDFYSYLLSKRIDGAGYDLRVYEDNIYIFDCVNKILVTVYPIPARYLPFEKFISHSSSPCLVFIRYNDGHIEYVCEADTLDTDIGLAIEFRTRQKAMNYIKNNNNLRILKKQGCVVDLLDLS